MKISIDIIEEEPCVTNYRGLLLYKHLISLLKHLGANVTENSGICHNNKPLGEDSIHILVTKDAFEKQQSSENTDNNCRKIIYSPILDIKSGNKLRNINKNSLIKSVIFYFFFYFLYITTNL